MNPKAVEKNSRKPSNRRTLMARISLAVAVLLGGFTWVSLDVWTAPAGLIWHAFHGSTVSFEGRKIPVPRDMWVRKTSDMAVIMIREAPKYPLLHSPAGTIVFERSPGRATDMSKDYATIAHANESPAQKGYQVQVLRFPAPNGPAFCWQTTHPDRSDLYISCYFNRERLSASYVGSPFYKQTFYEIVTLLSAPAAHDTAASAPAVGP